MDRVYKIRRASRDMASAYIPGDCNICQQSNVRVRRLKCGNHNFCKMCYEYEPKLARGDFSCTTCSNEKLKTRNHERTYTVDSIYSRHTGMTNNKDKSSFNGNQNKIIELDNTDDENDLNGCNTEWDHLLKSVSDTSRPVSRREHSPLKEVRKTSPIFANTTTLKKIPRKSSFIHLVLPSATSNYNELKNNAAVPQPIANTVTQLLDGETPAPSVFKTSPGSSLNWASPRMKFGREIITKPRRSLATFQTDPTEIERGTSPCKGIRLQKSYIWSDDTFSIDPSYSETEQMIEHIGTIEGPDFTSSSCSSSASGSNGIESESSGLELADEGFWD